MVPHLVFYAIGIVLVDHALSKISAVTFEFHSLGLSLIVATAKGFHSYLFNLVLVDTMKNILVLRVKRDKLFGFSPCQ